MYGQVYNMITSAMAWAMVIADAKMSHSTVLLAVTPCIVEISVLRLFWCYSSYCDHRRNTLLNKHLGGRIGPLYFLSFLVIISHANECVINTKGGKAVITMKDIVMGRPWNPIKWQKMSWFLWLKKIKCLFKMMEYVRNSIDEETAKSMVCVRPLD